MHLSVKDLQVRIAVLGSGLDLIYPTGRNVFEIGPNERSFYLFYVSTWAYCLFSEFLAGFLTLRRAFSYFLLGHNGLISAGLSLGVGCSVGRQREATERNEIFIFTAGFR